MTADSPSDEESEPMPSAPDAMPMLDYHRPTDASNGWTGASVERDEGRGSSSLLFFLGYCTGSATVLLVGALAFGKRGIVAALVVVASLACTVLYSMKTSWTFLVGWMAGTLTVAGLAYLVLVQICGSIWK